MTTLAPNRQDKQNDLAAADLLDNIDAANVSVTSDSNHDAKRAPLALEWLRAMRDIPLTAYERALGSILCTYGRGEDIHITIETMMRQTGFIKRTVSTALKGMLRKGVLVQLREGRGRGNTNKYRLAIPSTKRGTSGDPFTEKGSSGDGEKGASGDWKRGRLATEKGASEAPQDQYLDRKRKIVNHQITDNDAANSPSPRSRADDDELPSDPGHDSSRMDILESAISEKAPGFTFRYVSQAIKKRLKSWFDGQDEFSPERVAEWFAQGLSGSQQPKYAARPRVLSAALAEAVHDQYDQWVLDGQVYTEQAAVLEKLREAELKQQAELEAAREQQRREEAERESARRQQEAARIEAIRDEYLSLIEPFNVHPVVVADPKKFQPEPESDPRVRVAPGLVQYEPPRRMRPRPTPIGWALKMEFDVAQNPNWPAYIRGNEECVRDAIQTMRDVLRQAEDSTPATV
jgi:hypothetical protein